VWYLSFRKIAEGDETGATGKDRSKSVVGVTNEEMLERFAAMAITVEGVEKTRDGFGNFLSAATVAYGTRDGSNVANAAADAEVVSVDKFAFDFDFLAFDANVGDPVLAATVGAASDVKFELMVEAGIAVLQSFGEPASETLGFRESQFAEFGAGAGHSATHEGGTGNRETAGCEFGNDGGDVSL
jgi:hypothetical protein